ncbi:hypothetical protein [Rhodococcus sp. 27YEA15]|uniref:hypothetical protein n=1 Tax=Rhodococcus sp. 27YEA15 TaxID=3156259 RepID=UPI003C7B4FAD
MSVKDVVPECGPVEFVVEYLSTGAYAHGFGRSDGAAFAFRVQEHRMVVTVYSVQAEALVPGVDDVAATVRWSVTDTDLADPRSVSALVRDAVSWIRLCEFDAGDREAGFSISVPVKYVRGGLNSMVTIYEMCCSTWCGSASRRGITSDAPVLG